jgi:hydroxymethylpyrimidine pyrophosphatase-like HAD family hydrolase
VKALYVDVDGTLTGPGGDLLWDGSTRLVEALLRARAAGLAVVPVSGRGRVQVRELCRLLGFGRGIGELGCVHVEGREVAYAFGTFPFVGETPVEAMLARGAVQAVLDMGLEPHDPWNEGREATYLLRGRVDPAAATAALQEQGLGWCQLVDNGVLARRDPGGPLHAYHLAPAGAGKPAGVRHDRERHGLARHDTAYVGDAANDLACAAEVGRLWLVANADPSLSWPDRTQGAYGAGVAEVIDALL